MQSLTNNSVIRQHTLAAKEAGNNKFLQRTADANKWAAIWFTKLREFHRVPKSAQWKFSADQVVVYLKSRAKLQYPHWKRLKIVESLMHYQAKHPEVGDANLMFIKVGLKELIACGFTSAKATCQQQSVSVGANDPASNEVGTKVGTRAGTKDTANVGTKAAAKADERAAARADKKTGTEASKDQDLQSKAAHDQLMIDRIGRINKREPMPIQEMRRGLRMIDRARNTEKAYVNWLRRFLLSCGATTMEDCQAVDARDVEAFLTDLVVDGNVAPSTQDQAFYALQFFFEVVLKRQIGDVNALRSSKPKLRPTVMSKDEVQNVLSMLDGNYSAIAQLLYGCGLRISEALRLRIKDFDFDLKQISVHCSKGKKSRLVPLPDRVVPQLKMLMARRKLLHDRDVDQGVASVWLPYALDRKMPNACREYRWQFLFASARHSKDPKTGRLHRHHSHRDSFAAALRRAGNSAGILKYITTHTFRHSFATHLLQAGTDIRTVQELLGHQDVSTTMIYTHVLFDDSQVVKSPLDLL
jgi:integron integrase